MLPYSLCALPQGAMLKQRQDVNCMHCKSCVPMGEDGHICTVNTNEEPLYYREGTSASVEPCMGCPRCL